MEYLLDAEGGIWVALWSTPDQRVQEPVAGGLLRFHAGVAGRPPRRFKG